MDLTIVPNVGLGPFHLGSSLNTVFSFLRSHGMKFPRNDFTFHLDHPLHHDFLLTLTDASLTLRFDGQTQKLKCIDCFEFHAPKISFLYLNSLVCGIGGVPTLEQIYHKFGPTFPPEYEQQRKQWILKYPGIAFFFPAPPVRNDMNNRVTTTGTDASAADEWNSSDTNRNASPHYTTNNAISSSLSETHSALAFPFDVNSLCHRMVIHNSIDYPKLSHSRASKSPATSPPAMPTDSPNPFQFLSPLPPPTISSSLSTPTPTAAATSSTPNSGVESVLVFVNRGVFFPRRKATLTFFSMVSEVLADFGPPESVRAKSEQEDKMSIYSNFSSNNPSASNLPMIDNNLPAVVPASACSSPSGNANNALCDYFFFYPSLGFCLLFDGVLHRIKKMILFTNLPASPYFGRFQKCHFKIIDVDGKIIGAQQSGNATGNPGVSAAHLQQQLTQSGKKGMDNYALQRQSNAASGPNDFAMKAGDSSGTANSSLAASSSPSSSSSFQVDCNSRWADIHRHFNSLGFPYRHAHGPLVHTLPSHIHPFSPTLFYAYKGIVFEIHSKNEYIASVQLFHDALTFVSANHSNANANANANTHNHAQNNPTTGSSLSASAAQYQPRVPSSGSVSGPLQQNSGPAVTMNGPSDALPIQSKMSHNPY